MDTSEKYLINMTPTEWILKDYSDDVETIQLGFKNLTSLPDLSRFTKMMTLYCEHNDLIELPDNLQDSLFILYCHFNKLTYLPMSLPISLKCIYCSFNNLTYLPENICNLVNLLHLNCCENNLTKLPELPNTLKELDCSHNKLIILPEKLPDCLEYLNCMCNNLTELPEILPKKLNLLFCYSESLLKTYPKLKKYENNLNYVKERNSELLKEKIERIQHRSKLIKMNLLEIWEIKQNNPKILF